MYAAREIDGIRRVGPSKIVTTGRFDRGVASTAFRRRVDTGPLRDSIGNSVM